jgi:4-amino-4-deoxy-L-arabinose transferase-like glycosyltransferase
MRHTIELSTLKYPSVWRERLLWMAVLLALAVRIAGFMVLPSSKLNSMSNGYIRTAATLASGHRMLMSTKDSFGIENDVIYVMKQRQLAGGRVDTQHPYPTRTTGWMPATFHPAGYSWLLYLFYKIGNYNGMLLLMRFLQAGLDAMVCLLIFLFARNVFDRRIGLWAAWVYAILPPAIVQSTSFMPDSLNCFFMALVLWLSSYAHVRRNWVLLLAGSAVGLACNFRSEYLLLPGAVLLILWVDQRRFWVPIAWTAGMVATMLLMLVPWMLWTHSATGKALITSTGAGVTMYEALGENPNNPWNVVLNDAWVDEDARKRGFTTAWSIQADSFYRGLFRKCVAEHPGYYAKTVLFYRLPFALSPPYEVRDPEAKKEFSFGKINQKEGLTRWGVVYKYPLIVLRYMWREVLMMILSALLLLNFVGLVLVRWRDYRQLAWLVLPWAYTVSLICLTAPVYPRYVVAILIVQTVALAMTIVLLSDRRIYA